jgi:diguanylate cyclase (GGDEF)-like protein
MAYRAPVRRSRYSPGTESPPLAEEVLSARTIGRISATLFLLCGALVAVMAPVLPYQAGASRWAIFGVGLVAAMCGPMIWVMPWNRWGRASTILLVPVAMALVGLHNYLTGYDGFLYGLFFMVIFVWIGLGHPQGWSLGCGPLLAAAYLAPLAWGGHHPALAAGSAGYVLPCCILTGETVSWVANRLRRSEHARAAHEERLRHQAFHDPLTDLANRALFAERLTDGLARAGGDQPDLALLLFDLDGFKTVNDSLGHYAGDALLEKVADRLREVLGPGDAAARLGGDEFAVMVEGEGGSIPARLLAGRLMRALEVPFLVEGREMVVQASFGVALAGDGGFSADELLRNADMAMYRAKADGRGGVAVFEAHMHAAAVARLEVETELRAAIARDQFELYYQPQVSLPDGLLTGVEALIRWHHPVRGLVGPAEFIGIAEQTGLVVEIGRWVLETACRQLAEWQRGTGPDSVAVNLSARQLLAPDFVSGVAAALARSGAEPSGLTLELTESLLMEDAQSAEAVLTALRDLGVRIALDDFGTGYSSLSYLRQYRFDYLKIDKSFVDELADNGDRSVVAGILGLGQVLGMAVVAEGVESAEQADVLADLGCRLAQGFLFGRPMTAADLVRHWFLPGTASTRSQSPAVGYDHAGEVDRFPAPGHRSSVGRSAAPGTESKGLVEDAVPLTSETA